MSVCFCLLVTSMSRAKTDESIPRLLGRAVYNFRNRTIELVIDSFLAASVA